MSETKVAIVTGAGSGIGRCVCQLLDAQEWRLALVGRTKRKLENVASELRSKHLIVPADIADPDSARDIVTQTMTSLGRIDVLINNAGVCPFDSIESTNFRTLQSTFAANVFGPAVMIAACWPHFANQQRGCVVNTSSMAVVDPFPGLSTYAASKCALDSFTRSIASEGAEQNITAYSVAPGAVETPMLRSLFDEHQLPNSQTLDPTDIAKVIVDCALGKRPDDNGTVIVLPSG